jgi:hypothetical protein
LLEVHQLMRISRPAAILLALAIGVVIFASLGWALSLQQRVAALDALCRDEPTNRACGVAIRTVPLQPSDSAAPGASDPGSSPPSPSPSLGDPALGGAIWYPPHVDEASIVIAAADASAGSQERADVVVSGTAEDEINAAIAGLASHGGGQVQLQEGRFELAAPVVINGDGLSLVGVNVGNGAGYAEEALGTQLVPGDSFPQGEFLVHATGEAYGPLVSLIHMDGLDRAQGLNVESKRPTVALNAVTQSSGVGIRFAGESTGNRPYDGFVLFNRVFDGAGIGIFHDQRSGDMLIEGNIVFRNENDGFRCHGASQMYRVNHAYDNAGVGLRIIPGCVRTRLSSNKWEGNLQGGVSIEGGSGFTIIGDTFAHNDLDGGESQAHLQLGVRGDTDTSGVMAWGLTFGKGEDQNPYLIHVGPLASEIRIGPMFSSGGYTQEPVRIDGGADVQFFSPVPDPITE